MPRLIKILINVTTKYNSQQKRKTLQHDLLEFKAKNQNQVGFEREDLIVYRLNPASSPCDYWVVRGGCLILDLLGT